jgi:hypothetical protein
VIWRQRGDATHRIRRTRVLCVMRPAGVSLVMGQMRPAGVTGWRRFGRGERRGELLRQDRRRGSRRCRRREALPRTDGKIRDPRSEQNQHSDHTRPTAAWSKAAVLASRCSRLASIRPAATNRPCAGGKQGPQAGPTTDLLVANSVPCGVIDRRCPDRPVLRFLLSRETESQRRRPDQGRLLGPDAHVRTNRPCGRGACRCAYSGAGKSSGPPAARCSSARRCGRPDRLRSHFWSWGAPAA